MPRQFVAPSSGYEPASLSLKSDVLAAVTARLGKVLSDGRSVLFARYGILFIYFIISIVYMKTSYKNMKKELK